jgi:hypothetical protein
LILQIQAELELTMDQIQSVVDTVCPKPINLVASQANDWHLRQSKSFRLLFLRSQFDQGWWGYLCQGFGEAYEEIQQGGFCSERSKNQFDINTYRDTHGRCLFNLFFDSVKETIQLLQQSELDYIKQSWKPGVAKIEEVLNSIVELLNRSSISPVEQEQDQDRLSLSLGRYFSVIQWPFDLPNQPSQSSSYPVYSSSN